MARGQSSPLAVEVVPAGKLWLVRAEAVPKKEPLSVPVPAQEMVMEAEI